MKEKFYGPSRTQAELEAKAREICETNNWQQVARLLRSAWGAPTEEMEAGERLHKRLFGKG